MRERSMELDDVRAVIGCTKEHARRICLGILPPGEKALERVVNHFGWQWGNVKDLLAKAKQGYKRHH